MSIKEASKEEFVRLLTQFKASKREDITDIHIISSWNIKTTTGNTKNVKLKYFTYSVGDSKNNTPYTYPKAISRKQANEIIDRFDILTADAEDIEIPLIWKEQYETIR